MRYYEVIRVHEYINEILGMHVTAEDAEAARDILKDLDYTVLEVNDEFDRIYVK